MKKISQNADIHLNKKVLQLNVNYPLSSPRGSLPIQCGPAGAGIGVPMWMGGPHVGRGWSWRWKGIGGGPPEPTDTTQIFTLP